jgi:hypothetical protein
MLYDTLSGLTAAGAATPDILRYATSFQLTINTVTGTNGRPNRMGVPVLTITYRERVVGGAS